MSTAAKPKGPIRIGRPFSGTAERTRERFRSAAGIGDVGVSSVRSAFRLNPLTWVPEALVEFSIGFRRSFVANVVAHAVYLIGFGILALGTVIKNIGVVERQSGGVLLIWAREPSTWISMMVFAGIVGSAMTADIGARRVRDELDALDVLGVDRMRTLILPRVAAATLLAPVMAATSMVVVLVINTFYAPLHLGFSREVALDVGARTLFAPDFLVTVLLKNAIVGFFVGIVACHKGLTCKLGSEGVGKAVNQTVVITFFGIWLFNSLFNLMYLSLLPDASVYRG